METYKFVKLSYTGYLEDGTLFDTTDEQVAKQANIYRPQAQYGDMTICLGDGYLLKPLEDALQDAQVGKHTVSLPDAFGKKQANQVQLIATQKFVKQGIQVQPGLQVQVDNEIGVIKHVSGGRTLVDFNHPLASQTIRYEVEIKQIVSDPLAQATAYVQANMGKTVSVALSENKLTITAKQALPQEVQDMFTKEIQKRIPSIKEVAYNVSGENNG
ncbi:MAG: FKBP-type peptidyl-prolyl cis-trans isomerase [Candidatus Woesearchaeota archaeon]